MEIFFFDELTLDVPFFPRPPLDARACSERDAIEVRRGGLGEIYQLVDDVD